MLSEEQVDKVIIDYSNSPEGVPQVEETKTPSPPPKKKRGRKKKVVVKEEAGELVKPVETKEQGTYTSYAEQYENSILSEEYDMRMEYLKKQIRKYRRNEDKVRP